MNESPFDSFSRSKVYLDQDKDNYEVWVIAEGEDVEICKFFAHKTDIVWVQPERE